MRDEDCYKKKNCSACQRIQIAIESIGVALLAAILVISIIFVTPIGTTQIGGIQTQLTEEGNTLLPNDNAIVFNNLINDQSSDINYNSTTGEFTITKPGNYYVSWWVATDGSTSVPTVNFSVAINGVPHSMGSSPIVSGQVSGSALITVVSSPTTVTLVNTSTDDIQIANTAVQANMVIVEINP